MNKRAVVGRYYFCPNDCIKVIEMNINWEKRILLDVRAIIHKKRIKVIIAEKRSLALCSALSQSDQEMQSNSSKNPNALFFARWIFLFSL